MPIGQSEGQHFAGFRHFWRIGQQGEQHFGGLAAGGAYMAAARQPGEYGGQIHGFYHAQEFVGGIVLLAHGFEHGGAGGDAALAQEGFDFFRVKRFFAHFLEMSGIVEEHEPVHAPHIVDEIGIVKQHGVLFRLGREGAHHHHGGFGRQQGGEGVAFDFGHVGNAIIWRGSL